MKISEIQEDATILIDDFIVWLSCVRSPLSTLEAILYSDVEESVKIKRALRIWLASFIVTLITQLPLYQAVGIDVNNVAFHITNFGLLLLSLVASVGVIHMGMKIFRIPSEFADTLTIYTVLVVAFSPILTLLYYPGAVKAFYYLQSVKGNDPTFVQVVTGFYKAMDMTAHVGIIDIVIGILTPVMTTLAMLLLALLCIVLSTRYQAEKYRTFNAIGFSLVVLNLPVISSISLLYGYMLYVFIGTS